MKPALRFLWLLLASLVPCLSSVVRSESLAETQARFGVITGDVGLLTQGAVEWIEPHEGLPLEVGDRIRTGEDGRVELIASENALWVLEPETEVVSEQMGTHAGRLNLSSGTLLGQVDSARTAGTPQRWEFNTPVAVVAVRGTEFAIEVAPRQSTRLGVFEGEVEMQAAETAEGLPAPVRVGSGQEAFLRRGRGSIMLSKFGPRMEHLARWRGGLRQRQARIQRTWSPHTPIVRQELRRKFVAPAPKRRAGLRRRSGARRTFRPLP
jgi:hypothetical protein